MTNLQRPSTSYQMQRPSLTNDDNQVNSNEKYLVTRSYTFNDIPSTEQQQQPPMAKPTRPSSAFVGQRPPVDKPTRPSTAFVGQQSQRLGRSLLSNDNWRQNTMADIRLNAKAIDQSDQNILFGKGEK